MIDEYYVLGRVRGKSAEFYDRKYGEGIHVYLNVLFTDHPDIEGIIDCMCWKKHITGSVESVHPKGLAIIKFSKYKDGSYEGTRRQRILVKDIDRTSWDMYQILRDKATG